MLLSIGHSTKRLFRFQQDGPRRMWTSASPLHFRASSMDIIRVDHR